MIRRNLASELVGAATRAPVVLLAGPRQCGKTTLCRALFPGHPHRTLEAPDDRAFAADDPGAFAAQFREGAFVAEVQRAPGLLRCLREVVDANPVPGRWILTSSHDVAARLPGARSPAGWVEALRLLPLTWNEITRFNPHPRNLDEAMFSGGYPRIHDRNLRPSDWLALHVADYLERDVRTIGNVGDLARFQRFVELCAARSARLVNHSALAADCGISQPTAKAWTSILERSFVAFRLPAFRADLGKRLVKAPKLYLHDTGLLCWLLGIRTAEQLQSHPLRASIFETWVVSEIVKHRANRGRSVVGGGSAGGGGSASWGTPRGLSFYRDRNGAEVSLVIDGARGATLLDVRATDTPSAALLRGAERVRRHFRDLISPDVAVVHGGEGFRSLAAGMLIPWWRVRAAAFA